MELIVLTKCVEISPHNYNLAKEYDKQHLSQGNGQRCKMILRNGYVVCERHTVRYEW